MSIAVVETSDLAAGTPAPARMRRTPDTKVPAGVSESADGFESADGGHGGGGHGH